MDTLNLNALRGLGLNTPMGHTLALYDQWSDYLALSSCFWSFWKACYWMPSFLYFCHFMHGTSGHGDRKSPSNQALNYREGLLGSTQVFRLLAVDPFGAVIG